MSIVPHPGLLRDEMARLSELIGNARYLVATGEAFDLRPVGEDIAHLCQAVAALPPDQSKDLRTALEALSDRLARLGDEIQAHITANADPTPPSAPPHPSSP